MGIFDFLSGAGEKLFGSAEIDEKKIREHILGLGLNLKKFVVIADQGKKTVHLHGYAGSLEDKEKAIIAAGNVKGVEKVDDRMRVGEPQERPAAKAAEAQAEEPPAAEQPVSGFYTVQAGDTLSAIARKHYGNAGKYPVIFEANRPMLKHPDKIYPGQVLRIPKS
jgi:nucleoid-associated protein YgaU